MEIQERTLGFAVRMVKFVKRISRSLTFDILLKQLLRSATSIGANMREADSASSKRDFINKILISKKEAQETEYWLELIKRSDLIQNKENNIELESLLAECKQIILVLAAIVRNSRKND
jgi:four helix bundle protein